MSFGPLGVPELLFILVLALLIFGPKRLPDVGRTIGKGMAEFRKATSDLKRTIEREIDISDRPAPRKPTAALPRAAEGPSAQEGGGSEGSSTGGRSTGAAAGNGEESTVGGA